MGKRSEQTVTQRIYTNGQYANEKMTNIISHQQNGNQNPNEIPFHTHQDSYNQKDNNECWQGCRETGTLMHCW